MEDPPEDGKRPLLGRLKSRMGSLRHLSLRDRIDRISPAFVKKGARRITETDLDRIVERAETIKERFRSGGPLGRLVEDGRLLLGLVRDVRRGQYRTVPMWTVSAVGMALLYVLNPLDLIPDALPALGLIDDAAVVSACLSLVEQDLREYRTWLEAHPEASVLNELPSEQEE